MADWDAVGGVVSPVPKRVLAYERRQYEQAPLLASGARPDWAMRDPDMERARIRESERARMHMVITENGPITLQDYEAGRCRPSPAENAQRYSKPDWTW